MPESLFREVAEALKRREDPKRKRLVEAAKDLLRSGEQLTARSVAEAAGVSVGTVYNHFVNMDDLLYALDAERLWHLLDMVAEMRGHAARFVDLTERYLGQFDNENGELDLILELYQYPTLWGPSGGEARIAMQAITHELVKFYCWCFPQLPADTAEGLIRILSNTIRSTYIAMAADRNGEQQRIQWIREFLATMEEGLAARFGRRG